MDMAKKIFILEKTERPNTTPKELRAKLLRIANSATSLLQNLQDLSRIENEDLEKTQTNWRLGQELQEGRDYLPWENNKYKPTEDKQYPSKTIDAIEELIAVAKLQRSRTQQNRGNSWNRTPEMRLLDSLLKNFIGVYRQHFGYLPPTSKTGWVVDVAAELLTHCGIQKDAGDVLPGAIVKAQQALTPS